MAGDWNDAELARADDLDLLVHAARLLGADGSLAVGGAGAVSVKGTVTDVLGEPVDVLWATGRDADLAAAERAELTPLRLERLAGLAGLAALDDDRLDAELRAASLDPDAPAPSPAALLHVALPYRYVLQTPAAPVLALTATPRGADLVAEVYGDEVVVVPDADPGLALARACAERWRAQRHEGTRGIVLVHHGLCTFAHDARTAYAAHVELVRTALSRLEAGGAAAAPPAPPTAVPAAPGPAVTGGDPAVDDQLVGDLDAFGAGDPTAYGAGAGVPGGAALPAPSPDGGTAPAVPAGDAGATAALRRAVSLAAGRPVVLRTAEDGAARRLAGREDLAALVGSGPASPELVRHVGPAPLVGRDVDAHVRSRTSEPVHGSGAGEGRGDPRGAVPRVVVDPELGVLAVGDSPAEAARTLEVFEHTAWVAERAAALGGYVPPPATALTRAARAARRTEPSDHHRPEPLAGRVALVTGAGSPVGRATVRALVGAGAAVVGLDGDAHAPDLAGGPAYVGVPGDPTDPEDVEAAAARAVRCFGGLDVLVVGEAAPVPDGSVAGLSRAAWRQALDGAAAGALAALPAAHPLLRLAPAGAAVVVIARPCGSGAAGAAADVLARLVRVAAHEWAGDGIRVNLLEAGPVTGAGSGDGGGAGGGAGAGAGAAEVAAADVAAAVVALCGPGLGRTTGARVPVGGTPLPT